MLLSTDLLLIALTVLQKLTPYFSDPRYSITLDRGFGEVFQYTKEFWIACMFAWMAILGFQGLYAVWALIFGYLLVDDSMEIHERLGSIIAERFDYGPLLYIRSQDFGELTIAAAVVLVFLALLAVGYVFSDPEVRLFSRSIFAALTVLFALGVLVDVLDTVVGKLVGWRGLGLVEDGGEMLVMSFICWYVFQRPMPSPKAPWIRLWLGGWARLLGLLPPHRGSARPVDRSSKSIVQGLGEAAKSLLVRPMTL